MAIKSSKPIVYIRGRGNSKKSNYVCSRTWKSVLICYLQNGFFWFCFLKFLI